MIPTLDERTMERWELGLLIGDGCWPWQGLKRHVLGYGGFRINGRVYQASRVSHELYVGPIPEGYHVDHLCRNPPCVNPAHLEAVSCRENVLRGVGTAARNARKTHCIHGHPLTGGNLRVNNRGHRVCVVCNRAEQARFNSKRRGESDLLV